MNKELRAVDLVWDTELYPRQDVSSIHVGELVEALKAGQTLPPIIVEEKSLRIIDGVHRWRAWRKVFGDDSEIPCELRKYDSDGEAWMDAVDCNSAHGLRYSPFEQTKCILRADDLGISREAVAQVLRVTVERIERLVLSKTAFVRQRPVPIKGALRPLRGRHLTARQIVANKSAGGMNVSYYVQQVINLLRADAYEWAGGAAALSLFELRDVLDVTLKGMRRPRKKKAS